MNDFLKTEIRRKIFNLIAKNPGLNLSEIAKKLDIRISHVERYLISMEEKGKIFTLPAEGCVRYYISKSKKGARDRKTQEIRTRIFDILLKNPGLNLSEIAKKLDMSVQLAEYHLLFMEKDNFIIGVKGKGGYYRRFYVKDSGIGVRDKKVLALLRQEHLLRIVLIIMKNPKIQHKELSELLDLHPSTLTHHINRLYEFDLIKVFTYGREKGYRIKNKREIIFIIREYILDVITKRFKDVWEDIDPR